VRHERLHRDPAFAQRAAETLTAARPPSVLARLCRFYLPLRAETQRKKLRPGLDKLSFLVAAVDCAEAREIAMSLHEDKRVLFDFSERQRAEDALRRLAERQAMLLEVTSDLIRTSEPGELGRKTFEHVKSAFGAVVCTNYRLDPVAWLGTITNFLAQAWERLEAEQRLRASEERLRLSQEVAGLGSGAAP
jgi:hypothetical protein